MMDRKRAAQIIKQNAMTCARITNILSQGPMSKHQIIETLQRQGCKQGPNLILQYIDALDVGRKISHAGLGVYQIPTDEIPQNVLKTTIGNNVSHAVKQQLIAATNPEPIKKETEVSLNFNDLSPADMIKLSQQMAEMAAKKQKEIDPVLMRNLLAAGEQVVTVTDLLIEANDGLRQAMTAVRKAMGLPVSK